MDPLVKKQKIKAEQDQYDSQKKLKKARGDPRRKPNGNGDGNKCRSQHGQNGFKGDLLAVADGVVDRGSAGKKGRDGGRRCVRGNKMRQKHHNEDSQPEAADPLYKSAAEADQNQ